MLQRLRPLRAVCAARSRRWAAGIDLERSIDFDSIAITQWVVWRASRSVDPEDEWLLAQAGEFVQQARAFDGFPRGEPRLR